MTIYEYINQHKHCAVNNVPSEIISDLLDEIGVDTAIIVPSTIKNAIRYRRQLSLRFFNGRIVGYTVFTGYIKDKLYTRAWFLEDIISFDELLTSCNLAIEVASLI